MTPDSIAKLLEPYRNAKTAEAEANVSEICVQLAVYLDLILKWNARTNLTAIRTSEEIVRRHFGESLFVGTQLGACKTLLDYGSGAGFPGIPIQLLRPDVQITLAESQGKKAAFLREVTRTLDLPTEVWTNRVEAMPNDQQFDVVALRAVDNMDSAILGAGARAKERVLIMGTTTSYGYADLLREFELDDPILLPGSTDGRLLIAHRR